MSGGHFSYDQYRIRDIAEEVRRLVETNGKEVNGYQRPEYSQDTINEFMEAYKYLLLAEIYAQRIDWLISGDDGEETFHERLAEDLSNVADQLVWQDK